MKQVLQALVQNMGVNHRSAYVAVAEKFLDGVGYHSHSQGDWSQRDGGKCAIFSAVFVLSGKSQHFISGFHFRPVTFLTFAFNFSS
jgi:hypothetical protein